MRRLRRTFSTSCLRSDACMRGAGDRKSHAVCCWAVATPCSAAW